MPRSKPTREQWKQLIALRHSPKEASRKAREDFGLDPSKFGKNTWKHMNQVAVARNPYHVDPLIQASRTRKWRLEGKRERREQDAREKREKDSKNAIRKDLLRAARVARNLGHNVHSSKNRKGRISSYYIQAKGNKRRLRISDHDIPSTHERESRSALRGHGTFDGSADIYASDNKIRRPLWWKRAFKLALAGRGVPGYDS